ncbi:MAG: acyltransferase [Solirubrobacterales bacterium]|nr:acyltransferase [Solirubrobacterales bacterium]
MEGEAVGERRSRDAELVAGDALRAYALMAVVVFHIVAGVLLLDTGTIDFGAAYGQLGGSLLLGLQTTVYVFFALSAFLLSRPFVRAALGEAPFPSVRRYARHRVGRIVPAFWTAAVVILVVYGTQGATHAQVLALFGFAQVYEHGQVAGLVDHAWSVDVEMLFYAVLVPVAFACAWAVRRFRRGGRIAVLVVLAVAVVGAALEHAGLDPVTPVSQSPLGGLRAFLPGVLLAVLVVRYPDRAHWERLPRASSAVLAGVGLFLVWRTPHLAPEGDSLRLYLGTLSGGCILGAVVVRQFRGGAVWRPLRGPVVAWVGERSYSIFLVHGIVFWALHEVGAGQPSTSRRLLVALVVTLPAIMAAAQVLHVLVERPAMRYSRRARPAAVGQTAPPIVLPVGVPLAAGELPA